MGAVSSAPLRLVEGNAGAAYVFGGRLDEEESELFREAGLGVYKTTSAAESWQVRYEPGAIPDYYLDEREVSCAEYLAFVRAPGGFAARRHWPGAHPGEERRLALARELEARPGALPATGVSWDEAAAYAAWAGKRLPSLVEWEYALRGGTAYRPFACYDPGAADAGLGGVIRGDGPGAPAPRTPGEGADLTPETRIRDLSGSVSEWTATPLSLAGEGEAAGSPSAQARAHPAELHDPRLLPGWGDAPEYWAAGGSSASPWCDFGQVDARRRTTRAAHLGFRCALSADLVLAALEGGAAPELPVREVGEGP